MARGSKTAESASKSGLGFSNTLQGGAGNIYSTLAPLLTSQAVAPSGYAPSDIAAMRTAAMQSAGGSTAAAKGEGGLLAARTRNAGAPASAIRSGVRSAGEQLGARSVGIEGANADLKQRQREEAQSGLEKLYGTNVSGANDALGEVARNEAADAEQKRNSFWGQLGGGFAQGLGKRITALPIPGYAG